MSEGFIRHLVSFIAVIIALIIFYAGYVMGVSGWWWAGIATLLVYGIVYKLIEV